MYENLKQSKFFKRVEILRQIRVKFPKYSTEEIKKIINETKK